MSTFRRFAQAGKKIVFGPGVRSAANSELLAQAALHAEFDRLQQSIREQMPENPAGFGFKAYSQCDEDGIVQNILTRLDQGNDGVFVEIGTGNGTENNTHFLALLGWRGVWLEASDASIRYMREHVPADSRRLAIAQAFIDVDNVVPHVDRQLAQIGAYSIDLLSVDIDGNDLYVTRRLLERYQPAVVVVEYNARWRWPAAVVVPYEPNRVWSEDDFHGCSFARWVKELAGYSPVSCNLAGTNAFFVRSSEAHRFGNYAPQLLEQPARYHLGAMRSGHEATLKLLQERVMSSD